MGACAWEMHNVCGMHVRCHLRRFVSPGIFVRSVEYSSMHFFNLTIMADIEPLRPKFEEEEFNSSSAKIVRKSRAIRVRMNLPCLAIDVS